MRVVLFFILAVSSFSNEGNTITQAREFSSHPKHKKTIFINTVLPIIKDFEMEIMKEKEQVMAIVAKEKATWTAEEKQFLEKEFEKFKVKNRSTQDLLKKMILPPPSLILAQSIAECGYGASRVAREGNNLFGVASLSKSDQDSIKTGRMRYKKYPNIRASVEDYILILARNPKYENLREGIRNGEDSTKLAYRLGGYSELGKKYSDYVAKIIRTSSLQKYDKDFITKEVENGDKTSK